MQTFPKPHAIGPNCTRWKFSDVLAYEAQRDGTPAPAITPAEDTYMNVGQVAERFAVSKNTIWRWAGRSAPGKIPARVCTSAEVA